MQIEAPAVGVSRVRPRPSQPTRPTAFQGGVLLPPLQPYSPQSYTKTDTKAPVPLLRPRYLPEDDTRAFSIANMRRMYTLFRNCTLYTAH